MNIIDRNRFLAEVRSYTESDPECIPELIRALTDGLRAALASSQERAADMEILTSILLERRYPKRDELIKSKLQKWRHKCSLRWDWYLGEDGCKEGLNTEEQTP